MAIRAHHVTRHFALILHLAVVAALVCALGTVSAAEAEGFVTEVTVGALYHDMPWLWSNFQLEKTSVDVNVEAKLSPSMQFFFGRLQPVIGASLNTAGQTSMAYVDARWTYDSPTGYFFSTGLGLAIHDGKLNIVDGTHKALGSRELFHIPIEVGYRLDAHNSVSAYFEHMSNAYTQRNNEGMDRLGIRYGYRF